MPWLFGRRKEGFSATITWFYFNQISALIFIITEFILIELAHVYMVSQNLRTSIFLYHCWTWILIGVKVEWNSKVHLVSKSVSII